MRYLSVCSGIEAATVAWHPLGWTPVAFAEVEPFPCAVLAHHYPAVPNRGDLTRFQEWPDGDAAVDVLVGGTPCQSFSVAGLRQGLGDPRGNLALTYLALVDRCRPRWVVWENVPGVLSATAHDAPDPRPPDDDVDEGTERVVEDDYDADENHAFACFLAGLSELGYGWAYRSLDAQYFGLAQRRARVFVVGHLGDWRRAAAVLFERESLSGHPAPRREAGQRVAPCLNSDPRSSGGIGMSNQELFSQQGGGLTWPEDAVPAVAPTIAGCSNGGGANGPGRDVDSCESLIVSLGSGQANAEVSTGAADADVSNRSHASGGPTSLGISEERAHALRAGRTQAIAFSAKDHGADAGALAPTLRAGGHDRSHANGGVMPAVAFDTTQITSPGNYSQPQPGDPCHPLASGAHPPAIAFADLADPVAANQARTYTREGTHNFRVSNVAHTAMQVRRLTPRECERLQGFPDDYTLIPYRGKPAADGPRYKALGNSMAVPVMRWIGQRLALVDTI